MTPLPEYRVLRSRRRTISMEITRAGELLIRAPLRTPESFIRSFVEGRADWIEGHMAAVRLRMAEAEAQPKLSPEELTRLRAEARRLLEARSAFFAPLLGVTWAKLTVRTQRTRWGSCSAAGNLSFNALLALAPAEVLDYVVVHELCHRKEMNHSPRFWAEVERILPDWRQQRSWLRAHGQALMARLPEKN